MTGRHADVTDPMKDTEFHSTPARKKRSSTIKKIVMLVLLLLLFLLVLWATYYYVNNRRLPIPRIGSTAVQEVAPPEYLYSISGPPGNDALTRPVGVAVTKDDLVFATDTEVGVVRVYSTEGRYRFTISDQLEAPAHLAIGPDGNLYVSDRRVRAILVFTVQGDFIRKIVPGMPDANTWSPLAMTWDAAGNLYATDVGQTNNHRVIVFTPDGRELRRFGKTGRANQMSDFPGEFYFPNGIVVSKDGRLFVGDSNNRRIQVYKPDGSFDYLIRTAGIPRGLAIDSKERLYVVDALAHTTDVYSLKGERIVTFGAQGVGPGEFRYANDVALDRQEHIYISDRENHQIQVWAWPEDEIVVPGMPKTRSQWAALCAAPLLLLPLLLWWWRRKRFAVTEDFVVELERRELVPRMERRRWKWLTPQARWSVFEGKVIQGVDLGALIEGVEHSDSDARDLVDRMGITYDEAVLLVVAKRAGRLCTQDTRMASFAGALDIEVLDVRTFLERYAKNARSSS